MLELKLEIRTLNSELVSIRSEWTCRAQVPGGKGGGSKSCEKGGGGGGGGITSTLRPLHVAPQAKQQTHFSLELCASGHGGQVYGLP